MVKANDKRDDDSGKTLMSLFKGIGTYVNLALIAATFFINFGMFRADYNHLQKRLEAIEALKPEQMKWVQDQHIIKIAAVEQEQKNIRDTIFEMKTKIDVIAEWVKDQREKARETK